MALYFEHIGTKKLYLVKSWDKDTGEMILVGPMGEFPETFSKEHFKKMGYRPVQKADDTEEDDDDA